MTLVFFDNLKNKQQYQGGENFGDSKKKKKRKKQAIKHIKTFSNSAEQHFGNHVISNKELDLYMNFKKSIKKKKTGS